MDASESIAERYDRQIRFAGLGMAGQRKLAASSVLIVGAGGLGSALADQLGRAGVGRLRIVDPDIVEPVNLHRQHLYTMADNGAAKAVAASRHLEQINPGVSVEAVVGQFTRATAEALLAGVDLVLDGTDNWPSRFVLNDACVRAGLTWIMAGVVECQAVTMTIVPGAGPCLRCVYDAPPAQSPTCREVGVLGPAVQAIAAIQAIEAIKWLIGQTHTMSAALRQWDFWTNTPASVALGPEAVDPLCPCCKQRSFDYLR